MHPLLEARISNVQFTFNVYYEQNICEDFTAAVARVDACKASVADLSHFCDAPGMAEIERQIEDLETAREEIDDLLRERRAALESAMEKAENYSNFLKVYIYIYIYIQVIWVRILPVIDFTLIGFETPRSSAEHASVTIFRSEYRHSVVMKYNLHNLASLPSIS